MFKNITNEPLKVRNWNTPNKPETRLHKVLSMTEDKLWFEIQHEIKQDGTVTTEINELCTMP